MFQDDDAETIKEAFKLFDRDQDGYITCKELIKVQQDTFCQKHYQGRSFTVRAQAEKFFNNDILKLAL